jgi:hypothetical protein
MICPTVTNLSSVSMATSKIGPVLACYLSVRSRAARGNKVIWLKTGRTTTGERIVFRGNPLHSNCTAPCTIPGEQWNFK